MLDRIKGLIQESFFTFSFGLGGGLHYSSAFLVECMVFTTIRHFECDYIDAALACDAYMNMKNTKLLSWTNACRILLCPQIVIPTSAGVD